VKNAPALALALALFLAVLAFAKDEPPRVESHREVEVLHKHFKGKRGILFQGEGQWVFVLEGVTWVPPNQDDYQRISEVSCEGAKYARVAFRPTETFERPRFLIRPAFLTIVEPGGS
tara:strand:+ start:95 stop:445 length:351 start_codon:yes stop_codon:yes gene_type:complete